MRNEYQILDIGKYVAAMFVIAAHVFTSFPIKNMTTHVIVNGVGRLAVPFFFCCTGYFLAKKDINDKEMVLSFIIKLIKKYILLSVLYLPIGFVQTFSSTEINTKNILIYIQKVIMEGTFIHLWYFPAVILSVYLIYLMQKKVALDSLFGIFIPVYFIGLLGDGYRGLSDYLPEVLREIGGVYESIFLTTRNGFFLGIPFVLMGMFIYRNKKRIDKKKSCLLLAGLLVGIVVEAVVLRRFNIAEDYNLMVFIFPASYVLFRIMINTKIGSMRFPFRDYSGLLYEFHLIFYGVLLGVMSLLKLELSEYGVVKFILVVIITQAFAAFILKEKKKRKNIGDG